MNLLLDTNAIIWFAENDVSLTTTAKQLIESEQNIKFISIASFWELAIKVSLDKLKLNISIEQLAIQFQNNGIILLPLSLASIVKITTLLFIIYRSPFDKIIALERLSNNYTLISSDAIFDKYGVNRIW